MIIQKGKVSEFGACQGCPTDWSVDGKQQFTVCRVTMNDTSQMVLCQSCCDKLSKLLAHQMKRITQRRLRRALDKAVGDS